MITNILMKIGLISMATGAALVIIVGTITAMHSEQAFAAQNTTTTIISEPVKVQTVQTDLKNVQTDFKNVQTDLKNLQTDMTSPGKVGSAPTTTSAEVTTAQGLVKAGQEEILKLCNSYTAEHRINTAFGRPLCMQAP
jgi:peptidoglycan hydrolase CwlO-like protein